ncbi:MAG: DUF3500 domain-containing protein [bacterium]|nr:DUF3500 domain-containing protein [bacterium]
MKRRLVIFALAIGLLSTSAAVAWLQKTAAGPALTDAGKAFVATLSDEDKETALFKYDSPKRVDWHFIPKDERKGLQVKHMTNDQKKAAFNLLKASLSKAGYTKVTSIMKLESVLNELEGGKGRNIRDPQRYYVSLFGEPGKDKQWGLSIEGHHLSLNFVIADDKVISSTPQFLAANPATIKNKVQKFELGDRVLRDEEQLAFDLVNSLNDEQKKTAIIADTAPKEIRAAGEAQPPTEEAVGITADKLNKKQQRLLNKLVHAYADSLPNSVAAQRYQSITEAGRSSVHFAWAGATEAGIGHYYRVQGPSFLIEFVNTQPDPAGNPANHIHCVWRDLNGDFALPIK